MLSTLAIELMYHYTDNIFDLTKEWQTDVVPLQEIGRLTFTQNP